MVVRVSCYRVRASSALRGVEPIRRTIVVLHFSGKTLFDSDQEQGLVEMVRRVPGRAFALFDCLPVKYTAGEMDASSSEVSVQELTVQPEFWTELSMATLSRSLGTVGAIGGAVAGAGLNVVSGLL
jgi:hypothetical protein